jgi:hypothetical protein
MSSGNNSYIAVILAFVFTSITFLVVFRRNRKDEQLKMAIEMLKQLSDSDNLLENTLLQLKEPSSINIYGDKKYAYETLRASIIKHFNNWELFALLVNKKEIKDDAILEHFKENFITEKESMLVKYPDLENNESKYPQIKLLYDKWKKE